MGYWLGVDLGTTRTAAAIRVGDRVQIVQLGSRTAEVPSAIYVAADGNLLIGEAAVRRGSTDPARLATEFKRRVGDPVPMYIAGAPQPAHVLMARLLGWVVSTVGQQQGAAPDGVTVTCPANWGPYKRELFDQVLRLADLATALTLPEPVAAAAQFAAGERVLPGEHVAVYDLGGGTFDAAVLRKSDSGFELLGRPDGIEQLGGVDFDDAVFRHVLRALGDPADLDPLDPAVTSALSRLRRDCSEAKEGLSYDTEVVIPVALPDRHTQVRLHRSEFEEMIRPALASTVQCLLRAVQSAGIEPQHLRSVLLSGGSSRIPLVGQLVADAVRRPVVLDTSPEHSIAMGATRPVAGQGLSDDAERPAAAAPTEQIRLSAPPGRPPAGGSAEAALPGGRLRRRQVWIAVAAAAVPVAGTVFAISQLVGGDGDPGGATAASPQSSSARSSSAAESTASSGQQSGAGTSGSRSVQPVVLPDSSLLVARSSFGEDGLFAVDALTGQLGPRMPTTGVERPMISPDRQRMIYIQTYAADESELWIARVDGRNEQRVFASRLAGCDRYLVAGWNPVEPDQIVLPCLDRAGQFSLRIVRLDGSVVQEFDLGGRFVDGATFAPDGRSVAFNSAPPGEMTQAIYAAAVDGSTPPTPPTRLTSGTNDVAPSWSPDGSKIVFMRENAADPGRYSIVVMNADGSDQRVVGSQDGVDDVNPAWSTDGRSIVFRSDRGQQSRVGYRFWVMDADGGNPRELLPGDTGEALSTPGWARR